MCGKYEAVTTALEGREEAEVILTFDQLDSILHGLPPSARTYSAWCEQGHEPGTLTRLAESTSSRAPSLSQRPSLSLYV